MDFNLEHLVNQEHPAIIWKNYLQKANAPSYTSHYTHYRIFNPENAVVPPVPIFYGDSLEPLVAAWQSGTINYDAQVFSSRLHRIPKYRTVVIDPAQQRHNLRQGEPVLPNPQIGFTTLAYAYPQLGFKAINTATIDGPTYSREIHEQAHLDHPEWSERQVREYTFRVTNDYRQLPFG